MKKDSNTKISKQNKLKEIFKIIEKYDVSNYEISKNTGISEAGLGSITNGETKNPREITVNSIYNYLIDKYENSNTDNLPPSELKPKIYNGSLKVRLVTNRAKAGWCDGYYADEYLKDMPIVIIEAEENYKGNYMAFEIDGDSMEPDYIEGNVVVCREIQRHLWQSKLHYEDWDFVIAHAKDGIYIKEIINHDVERGIITCRSLNPKYEDFDINLREVAHLYNIVEVRQKGKNKRWNRVRDYL